MNSLKAEREILDSRCHTDAFPGSKAWSRAAADRKVLAAFDAKHPEVKAQAEADRLADQAERNAASSAWM